MCMCVYVYEDEVWCTLEMIHLDGHCMRRRIAGQIDVIPFGM